MGSIRLVKEKVTREERLRAHLAGANPPWSVIWTTAPSQLSWRNASPPVLNAAVRQGQHEDLTASMGYGPGSGALFQISSRFCRRRSRYVCSLVEKTLLVQEWNITACEEAKRKRKMEIEAGRWRREGINSLLVVVVFPSSANGCADRM